jgi:YHS domain-containing protein
MVAFLVVGCGKGPGTSVPAPEKAAPGALPGPKPTVEPHQQGEEAEPAHHEEGETHSHPEPESTAALPEGANQTCPVMTGEKVDPNVFFEYKGKKIYTCCPKCLQKVKEDPEKYFGIAYGTQGD